MNNRSALWVPTLLRLGVDVVHNSNGAQKRRQYSQILDGQMSLGEFFFGDCKLRQLLGQRVHLHPEITNMS